MSVQWPDMSKLIASQKSLDDAINDKSNYFNYENRGATFSPSYQELPFPNLNTVKLIPDDISVRTQTQVAEHEEDYNDEEEIMQWLVSGMLPSNTENILALNQAYQETIQKCLARLDGHLEGIHAKQNYVNDSVHQIPLEFAFQQALKVPSLQYVPPYFRDLAGICPNLREEFYKKSQHAEHFDMLVEPPRRWSKRSKYKLIDSVRKHSFQKLLRPLLNMKEILSEKLNEALKNEYDDSEILKKIRLDVKENERKIRFLRKERELGNLSLDEAEGIDWNQVGLVKLEGSRSAIECELAWYNEFHPNINRSKTWSKEELIKLKEFVECEENSHPNFAEIALKLGTNRTAFQCAEKYQMELNEKLIKKQWTPEEDKILKDTIEQYQIGAHIPWELVVKDLDGRTRTQCQVRWGRTLDPHLKHGRWDEEEDKLLLKAVDKYGSKDWGKIAQIVVGRTDSQCRERWCTALDAGIKEGRWTEKEDAVLNVAVSVFGTSQWAKRKIQKDSQADDSKNDLPTKNPANQVQLPVNKRLKRQIERKERVRQWYLNSHGRLPKAVVTKSVESFLNTLPAKIKNLLQTKLAIVYSRV